jgi:hypothetical protein
VPEDFPYDNPPKTVTDPDGVGLTSRDFPRHVHKWNGTEADGSPRVNLFRVVHTPAEFQAAQTEGWTDEIQIWDPEGSAETRAALMGGQQVGTPLADSLLARLRAHPAGLTLTAISDALGRNRGADDIQAALAQLLETGLARVVKEPLTVGAGRPAARWFAIDSGTNETN